MSDEAAVEAAENEGLPAETVAVTETASVVAVQEVPEPVPSGVVLRLRGPHDEFDLSPVGLPNLTKNGTSYASSDADRVLMLGRRYNVQIEVVER